MDYRMVTIGDNCIDVYLPPVDLTAVGGQALNVAVTWKRLGCQAEYLGAVGDDAAGQRIVAALLAEGVIADRVQVLPGRTGLSRLLVNPDGDRVLVFEDQGVCARYAPSPDDLNHLAGATYVHAANLPGFRRIVRELSGRSVPMSYDFSTTLETDGLEGLDAVFYSWPAPPDDPDLHVLARGALRGGARLVVATCGPYGSAAFDAGGWIAVEATPVHVVDTCGAGDTYTAVFLLERIAGTPLPDAMSRAAQAAAEACTHVGAWTQPFEPASGSPS